MLPAAAMVEIPKDAPIESSMYSPSMAIGKEK